MTPEQWLSVLEPALLARQRPLATMDAYYTGNHPLPFVTKAHQEKIRNEFRQLLDDSRTNFSELVVDAVAERLRVEGFRLSAANDQVADRASWDIWQANGMDSESQVAFVESLVKGVSYVSVWGAEVDGGYASMAVEDPLQTIVAYDPGSGFRRRSAALKVWRDSETGLDRANVYLPDGIYRFETKQQPTPVTSTVYYDAMARQDRRWVPLEEFAYVPNPVGVVPIVPLRNRPRLLVEGRSELENVCRIQNQINAFVFLLGLAGYFGAHRQRWMAGVALFDDDNKPLDVFDAAIDRLWASENPDARFGDFDQTDLSGYIRAIEQKVQHIAVTTRTPKHYLLPEGQEPSGDAIKSAEAGLVKKVKARQLTFGEGLEEALRLARRFQGEPDAPVDSEIVWADPQIRTEAEVTDATIKKFQAQLITWEQACQDIGYSPQTIARMLEAFGGVAPSPSDSTAAGAPAAA